jgi:hypothetical protein
MANELAVRDEGALAILIGGDVTSGVDQLPTLRVNARDIDKEGNEYPVGVFGLYDEESEGVIYGDIKNTKILMHGYQVREYNEPRQEYASETIFFYNGREDNVEDTAGGYRCGKMKSKLVQLLNDNDSVRDEQRKKKFYRVIWGVTDIKGVHNLKDKKKYTATNVPFIMRLTGNAFMPMCNYIEGLEKVGGKAAIANTYTNLTIEKRVGSSQSYYLAIPTQGEESPLSDDEEKTIYAIDETRTAWNDRVMSIWRKKNGMNVSKSLATEAIEVAAVVIEPEMDDEIPF